jgi:hypothetical protein
VDGNSVGLSSGDAAFGVATAEPNKFLPVFFFLDLAGVGASGTADGSGIGSAGIPPGMGDSESATGGADCGIEPGIGGSSAKEGIGSLVGNGVECFAGVPATEPATLGALEPAALGALEPMTLGAFDPAFGKVSPRADDCSGIGSGKFSSFIEPAMLDGLD